MRRHARSARRRFLRSKIFYCHFRTWSFAAFERKREARPARTSLKMKIYKNIHVLIFWDHMRIVWTEKSLIKKNIFHSLISKKTFFFYQNFFLSPKFFSYQKFILYVENPFFLIFVKNIKKLYQIKTIWVKMFKYNFQKILDWKENKKYTKVTGRF